MQPYQEKYIQNAKEISEVISFYRGIGSDFDSWYSERTGAVSRIAELKKENLVLLNDHLFPALDDLFSATEEDIEELEQFAGALLDWKTNLDCGVYLAIHEALLAMYRTAKNRYGVIKELYLVGMGQYYQRRMVEGIDADYARELMFQNELSFTEAASYLRFYDEINDSATRGYIVRAQANIALCTKEYKKRINAISTAMQIIQDEHYRSLAPDLPWDRFLLAAHQQMSSNRSELSRKGLTQEELALVLDSCYEVFKPQLNAENPSIRWLWPYYEMEYNCGYVDLATTMERLEELIEISPEDQYDQSGLYGNVQLPIYYGRLIQKNPQLQSEERYIRFLDKAYRKMERTMLSFPSDKKDDFTVYLLTLVLSDYYELEGVTNYRRFTSRLLEQFAGDLYIFSRRVGKLMRTICEAILDEEPGFFSDFPYYGSISDEKTRRSEILDYAENCGIYHRFGLLKMNITRPMESRQLFADEDRIYMLYPISGHDDLAARASTREFSDIALGHRRWYNGSQGFPDNYHRLASEYRQMTDICSLASYLAEQQGSDPEIVIRDLLIHDDGRFSPMILSYLTDDSLIRKLSSVLAEDTKPYFRRIYDELGI